MKSQSRNRTMTWLPIGIGVWDLHQWVRWRFKPPAPINMAIIIPPNKIENKCDDHDYDYLESNPTVFKKPSKPSIFVSIFIDSSIRVIESAYHVEYKLANNLKEDIPLVSFATYEGLKIIESILYLLDIIPSEQTVI